MKGKSYIKLPQELQHSSKGLINMKNNDIECFRWCHIRHLNPQNKDPQCIKKVEKEYIEKLDYKNNEFPVTIKQTQLKNRTVLTSMYLVLKINNLFQSMHQKKSMKIL